MLGGFLGELGQELFFAQELIVDESENREASVLSVFVFLGKSARTGDALGGV